MHSLGLGQYEQGHVYVSFSGLIYLGILPTHDCFHFSTESPDYDITCIQSIWLYSDMCTEIKEFIWPILDIVYYARFLVSLGKD